MGGLGEDLRAAREARNLSLSDVSERIHIRSVYLQSLEDEDWGAIAAPVYVRGFLRTYARFLGVDAEAAVAKFNDAIPEASHTAPPSRPGTARSARGGPSIWLWIASVAAIVLVGFVGYNYYELQRDQSSAPSALGGSEPSARPAPGETGHKPVLRTAAAPQPAPQASANTVAVRLVQRSWLRVAVDGTVPMEGIYPAGTERVFHGKTATVRAGNAAGVDVRVNGRDVGTLGAAGDVVERTFTLAQE
jgi:transcriptional regulator with XRE-family HTH domain